MYTYAATFILALVIGFTSGWKVQGWRWDSDNLAKMDVQRENERLNHRKADTASEGHEKRAAGLDAQFQVIYSEVERVTEKPVYHNVCFDADGMRELSNAIGSGTSSGESAPTVQKPD